MLANYDSMFRCRRHPAQPSEGICALCLKERLTRLACPCCGGLGSSHVSGISCKCSPLESASKFDNDNQDPLQQGNVRTIASLVQSDIETSQRLKLHHKLNDTSDHNLGGKNTQFLRRTKSISLAKNSIRLNHDWESRSSTGSRRKTEPNDAFDQTNVEAGVKSGDTTSQEESEKQKVSEVTTDGRSVISIDSQAQKYSSIDGFKDNKVSNRNKGVNQLELDAEAKLAAHEMQQCGDASTQIHEYGVGDNKIRLSKSKSTGWILNDGGWKGSPFWGRLIHTETKKAAKMKGLGIFKRSRSTRLCSSIAFQREEHKPTDINLGAKRTSASDHHVQDSPRITKITGAIQSRWATLRGRNSSGKASTERPKMDCRATKVMGDHFRYRMEESSSEVRSISSLIFMDTQERLGLASRKHFKVNYLGFNQLLKIK